MIKRILGYISSLRDNYLGKLVLTAVFVAVGLFTYNQALAAAVVTAATGGTSVSIDTTSAGGTGAWTTLTATTPKIVEGAANDIKAGAHIFTLPSGWEINTTSPVTVSATGGSLAIAGTTATTTTNTFMFIVTATTTAATGTITFSGIQVRPFATTTTSSGNITYVTGSSAGITGVNGSTNFGTLTTVAGTATQLVWVTQPATSVLSTATWTLFSIKIADQFGNQTSGTNSVTAAPTSGSFSGTTATTSVAGLASFNNIAKTVTGTTTVYAIATGLATSSNSSVVTISPGAIDHFTVTGITSPVAAGASTTPVVTAFDINGNIKTNYTGTITFTSSDVGASTTLPSPYTFLGGDNGTHTFTNAVVLTTATTTGTVIVTDAPKVGSQHCAIAASNMPGCSTQP